MLNILCFGDSIILGEKDIEQGGWVDRLKTHFFQQFENHNFQEITLYNLGVAGETTDGLCQRFEQELKVRNINGQKLLIVLAYGANDVVIHQKKNITIVPQAYFIRNLKQCIELTKKYKANVLLLNILPISNTSEGKINQHGNLRFNQDIKRYNEAMKKLSQNLSCDYFDLYSSFEEDKETYLCNDGVHPNVKGHRFIYLKMRQKIAQLYELPTDNINNK